MATRSAAPGRLARVAVAVAVRPLRQMRRRRDHQTRQASGVRVLPAVQRAAAASSAAVPALSSQLARKIRDCQRTTAKYQEDTDGTP
jgi:hypothetical protein